jgi:hypothetical protein
LAGKTSDIENLKKYQNQNGDETFGVEILVDGQSHNLRVIICACGLNFNEPSNGEGKGLGGRLNVENHILKSNKTYCRRKPGRSRKDFCHALTRVNMNKKTIINSCDSRY